MSAKAENIIKSLFSAFLSDSRLLPPEAQQHATRFEKTMGDNGRARAIADYIAGMTDRYAILEYEKIFSPRQLT
jgi:dGTPase